MKTLSLTLLALILLLSCSDNEITSTEDASENMDEIETSFESEIVFDSAEVYLETYEDSIYDIVHKAENLALELEPTKTFENEVWTYAEMENNVVFVCITKEIDDMEYLEEYILQNDKLVFAFESEQLILSPGQNPWNCQYVIKDNQVINYSSLGHGETESDEWEPESIIEQWKSHEKNFNQVKNK